tara:strand:+ start:108 stop:557 length:450 start_codon:yes stop_codon:yes gene_type:complete
MYYIKFTRPSDDHLMYLSKQNLGIPANHPLYEFNLTEKRLIEEEDNRGDSWHPIKKKDLYSSVEQALRVVTDNFSIDYIKDNTAYDNTNGHIFEVLIYDFSDYQARSNECYYFTPEGDIKELGLNKPTPEGERYLRQKMDSNYIQEGKK